MKFSEWLTKHYTVEFRDTKRLKPPWLWRKLTWISAIAIKEKYVYVRDLDRMHEKNLCKTLTHEGQHIVKQRKLGWGIYLIAYGLSRSFRRSDEVAAYTNTMEIRHMYGLRVNPDYYARVIRDSYRVGRRQYRKAKGQLRDNHRSILSGGIHAVRNLYEKYCDEVTGCSTGELVSRPLLKWRLRENGGQHD